jgi:hypothetical protein
MGNIFEAIGLGLIALGILGVIGYLIISIIES